MMVQIIALLILLVGTLVHGQTTGTGSASLNAPSSRSASATRTAAQVTQTVVPNVNLDGNQVPFLLARPIPSDGESRMKDVYFNACPDDQTNYVDSNLRLNISAVYSQLEHGGSSAGAVLSSQYPYSGGVLRIVAVGATDSEARSANPLSDPPLLSTLSVETQFLTFDLFRNNSYLCDSLYPTTADPNGTLITPAGCLYGPGQVSLGVGIPLNDTYTLGTIWTRIRISDTSSPPLDIACFEVYSSPYNDDKWYWHLILWFPIALTIGFFVVIAIARILAAASSRANAFRNKAREGSAPNMIKDTVGPTMIAALSGQKLALSAALLRFATPGCWDVILHTQFVAAMAMVAVRWPEFSYPFFQQAAWSTLVGNVTLIRPESLDSDFNLLQANARLPEGDLGTQFSTTSSPLYMDESVPNRLLNLDGAKAGMEAFAHVVGLRTKDLFGTCISIWLMLVAAVVVVSLAAWIIDSFHDNVRRARERREDHLSSQQLSDLAKNKNMMMDDSETPSSITRSGGYRFLGQNRTHPISNNSVNHLCMLHGNVARAIALFHLPITIFTTYEMANADVFSATAVALASLSFAIFSILIPVYLLFNISRAPTSKLYDSVGTLSALGPLYNTYSPGSQLFCAVDFAHTFILGVVIGAGQASGTAQAIIILVVEIAFALACSLWLPWGEGALMGPVSFIANVLRIITAVCVLLLSPVVNFKREPIGWITYVILLIQAILYVCAGLMLAVKIVEGIVRIVGKVPFDEKASHRSSGLGGAIRTIRGGRRAQKSSHVGTAKGKKGPLNRSGSTNTQTLMLSDAANPGLTTPGAGMQRLPPHSRQTSFASHLDRPASQLYGRRSPGDMLSDPSSVYSSYFRGDPNDEGYIMSALPPQQSWNGGQSPPASSGTGFVRVGGGRATDSAPYQARSRPVSSGALSSELVATMHRPRPLSQSAIVESYQQHRLSMPMEDPNSYTSTEAAARHSSMKRYPTGASLRPTTSIAGMMAVDEEQQATSRRSNAASKGKLPFWKKQQDPATHSDSDDDDDDGMAPFQSQGGWRGLNKMSAAMGALAARLGGKSGLPEEADTSLEPPSSEGGMPSSRNNGAFEVVRPPQRPRKHVPAPEATAAVTPPREAEEIDSVTNTPKRFSAPQPYPYHNAPPKAKMDEEMFWVSTSRPPSQLSMSQQPLSKARLAEPMQAELLHVGKGSDGPTPPGLTPPTAIPTPALSTTTADQQSFFDAQGNVDSEAINFDTPTTAQPNMVWDAARAYRHHPL